MSERLFVKICSKCHREKLSSDFYKQSTSKDGHNAWCKTCHKQWQKQNPECSRKSVRKYLQKNPTYLTEWKEKNKSHLRRYWRRYKRQLPEEIKKAYVVFKQAKLTGAISPQPCEICGMEPTVGHHEDYSKPLEVVWLCDLHHREIHGRLNDEGKTLCNF